MDEDTRRRVCRLIAGIVVVDDELDESEDLFIDRMLAQFELSTEERDALFPIMDTKEAADEFRALGADVQKEALELLVQAAAVDRKYADEEKVYLHAVCEAAGVSTVEVDRRVHDLIAGS
ncbi:MAG TPA: hypothetical protein PLJ27_24455 [Polyangiaceae bacterium]|jgi:uncharacterized tellurite resistance protein B-like protein|nr:MAG: Tellurite resistance protein TerB [Deltaproteobacteria bacterium ADurb.Bin207]HNS96139.1 hypothetical protein [Polyangiaceae bacterium]HNZ22225.1 hypothetical protein [Polyangiaceae bacterium]HOD22259.1 hypothetical protein [Polyangiaceae bacterium]HOE47049.1 hypothetical protein [Polyangiaceae bacterium]